MKTDNIPPVWITCSAAHSELGISQQSLSNHLAKRPHLRCKIGKRTYVDIANLRPVIGVRGTPGYRVTAEEIREVSALFQSGKTIAEITKITGQSRQTVERCIFRAGHRGGERIMPELYDGLVETIQDKLDEAELLLQANEEQLKATDDPSSRAELLRLIASQRASVVVYRRQLAVKTLSVIHLTLTVEEKAHLEQQATAADKEIIQYVRERCGLE